MVSYWGMIASKMSVPVKFLLSLLLLVIFGILLAYLIAGHPIPLVHTKGLIATRERNLMLTATLLMLIIVVPVLVLTFAIAWRYRAENTRAAYRPEWDHSLLAESIWWSIPCVIISALAIITWNSTHQLDPSKAVAGTGKSITIQVVALPWKWLFIYPEQQIASVNMVRFPTNAPVTFIITADAPMNSFSIPELSGQIYAMPGMSTELNMIADQDGTYRGQSANLSGAGFAGMTFTAQSSSEQDFTDWVSTVKKGATVLNTESYTALAVPSANTPVSTFATAENGMYAHVLSSYMSPNTPM